MDIVEKNDKTDKVIYLMIKKMKRANPSCYGKCTNCFFYFINGCVALSGEDCFLEITQKHAQLIINNRNRFDITSEAEISLVQKFPQTKRRKELV